MNSRAIELALRRERLILRSERLRYEIADIGIGLESRIARIDQIARVVRRFASKSTLMTLGSVFLYFARGRKRRAKRAEVREQRGPMRLIGRGLMLMTLARRALTVYRLLTSR